MGETVTNSDNINMNTKMVIIKMVVVTKEAVYDEDNSQSKLDSTPEVTSAGNQNTTVPTSQESKDYSSFTQSDPQLCLELLRNGLQSRNRSLVKECIENLDFQLVKTNVLFIYYHLSFILQYITTYRNDLQPSAPLLVENESQKDATEWLEWIKETISALLHNCLLEIDKHADFVLQQKEFFKLPYEDVLAILTRNTLQVTSERSVYITVMKWTEQECEKTGLPRRDAAKALRYAPRYGLMSKKDFESKFLDMFRGPKYSGLLEEREWRKVLFYMKEINKHRQVDELPYKGSQPRIKNDEKATELSTKSLSRAEAVTSLADYSKDLSSGDKWAINLLTCWSTIFD